jgi:hypothetical protein
MAADAKRNDPLESLHPRVQGFSPLFFFPSPRAEETVVVMERRK